ncbi:MAG: DUF188 domain-containing protein [Peptococcaceae bacterium]|nr:DUF188 domain-containing protein [Peptococcaceae bacterium]
MKIIIDADACPREVLKICHRLAKEFDVPLWTVASFNHNVVSDHHIVVGNAPQEADIKITNLVTQGDIVVTQDWGLAALVLGKGASALSPAGRVYKRENIEFLLEERELKARYRRGGGRTKGPKKRAIEDDRRFTRSLCLLLSQSGAQAGPE